MLRAVGATPWRRRLVTIVRIEKKRTSFCKREGELLQRWESNPVLVLMGHDNGRDSGPLAERSYNAPGRFFLTRSCQ